MPQPQKPDRSNRIILIGLMILAVVTIGATIIATTNEWDILDAETGLEEPASAPAGN